MCLNDEIVNWPITQRHTIHTIDGCRATKIVKIIINAKLMVYLYLFIVVVSFFFVPRSLKSLLAIKMVIKLK